MSLLFIISFKNIVKLNYVFCTLFILLNLNFLNVNYLVDSFYIYLLNQLININFNLILIIFIFCWVCILLKFNISIYSTFIIFCLYEYCNYTNISKLSNYNLNINLINGFFIIHPLLVYIYYALTFLIIIVIFFFKYIHNKVNTNNLNDLFNIFKLNKIFLNMLYIIIIAIFLGSWWAYQELSWGTWWNWDSIEILNLIYLLLLLNFHHKSLISFLKISINCFIIQCCFVILLFFLVRYSIIQSIHNFLNIEIQNQFNIYVHLYAAFILLLLFYFKKLKKYSYISFDYLVIVYVFVLFLFLFNIFLSILNCTFNTYITLLKLTLSTIFYVIIITYLMNIIILKNTFYRLYITIIAIDLYFILNFFLPKKLFRVYKYIHLNVFLYFIIILNFYFEIKLSIQYFSFHKENYYIYLDTATILDFINIKVSKITNYIQGFLFFNHTSLHNLNSYLSYSTQVSNVNYTLSSWVEFLPNKNNKYLFVYLTNFLIIQTFVFTHIQIYKFISKIYF